MGICPRLTVKNKWENIHELFSRAWHMASTQNTWSFLRLWYYHRSLKKQDIKAIKSGI